MATVSSSPKDPSGEPLKPQMVALNVIKADDKLQPRMGRDPEHQQRMARAYEEGDEIPPAVHLFFDGKFYWLVDGFHRFHAMWSLRHLGRKFQHIKAFVHRGTKQEAIAYAAVANLDSRSKPMTDEDRRKAMHMLMEIQEWREKSPSFLGKKFGLSAGASKKYWIEYYSTRNLDVPKVAQCANGTWKSVNQRPRKNGMAPKIFNNGTGTGKIASVFGKTTYLGKSDAEAELRLSEIMEEKQRQKTKYEDYKLFDGKITKNSLFSEPVYSRKESNRVYVHGRSINGVAVTRESFRDKAAVTAAFGRVMHAKHAIGATRAVVLCPVADGPREIMDDYTRAYGVEWMTIEDFIASLKSQTSRDTPDTPQPPTTPSQ